MSQVISLYGQMQASSNHHNQRLEIAEPERQLKQKKAGLAEGLELYTSSFRLLQIFSFGVRRNSELSLAASFFCEEMDWGSDQEFGFPQFEEL